MCWRRVTSCAGGCSHMRRVPPCARPCTQVDLPQGYGQQGEGHEQRRRVGRELPQGGGRSREERAVAKGGCKERKAIPKGGQGRKGRGGKEGRLRGAASTTPYCRIGGRAMGVAERLPYAGCKAAGGEVARRRLVLTRAWHMRRSGAARVSLFLCVRACHSHHSDGTVYCFTPFVQPLFDASCPIRL